MKLSDKERTVYLALQRDASASVADLAKSCKLTQSVVRYAIESMSRRSIMQTSLLIDEAKLGLRHIKYLIQIAPSARMPIAKIEQTLANLPGVTWLTRVTGQYSHYLSLWLRDTQEAGDVFDSLKRQVGAVITQYICAEGIGWEFYGKNYLHSSSRQGAIFRTGYPCTPVKLDERDIEIVGELANQPLLSARELARRLGRPVSSITYRRNKLIQSGVIGAPVIRMRITEMPFLAYFLQIRCRYPSQIFTEKLHKYAAAQPNIVELCNCIGSWDFELGIEAEDAPSVHSTISDMRARFPEYIDDVLLVQRFGDVEYSFDGRRLFKSK
ncbi:Lrp/AsnC family transcriptional regulator [bacterium]|nr:Lrp/AsnC family transcriptional regulator [bacterium]